jgi:transposase
MIKPAEMQMSSNSIKSIKASVRELYNHALNKQGDGEPGETTKTLKFKIDPSPENQIQLTKIFDAQRAFLRDVLQKLEGMWDKHPEKIEEMANCSGSKPFEKKTSCYGWLLTKFLTGSDLPENLSRSAATASIGTLAGNLKSFLTRRKNVLKEMANTVSANAKLWDDDLPIKCKELELDLFKAPPKIKAESLNAKTVDEYNEWVASARVWCNLILVQKNKVPRSDACFPKRLKAYPGFPFSVKHKETAKITDAVKSLQDCLGEIKKTHLKAFDSLTEVEWQSIVERFPSPKEVDGKGTRRLIGKTLAALHEKNPNWKPVDIVKELIAGMERSIQSLVKHLEVREFTDRKAAIKLMNHINHACVFLLEPLRVRNDYKGLYEKDTPRRNAFGEARGSLSEATDEADSLQIVGFSLNERGGTRYDGLLAYTGEPGSQKWAFFYDPEGPKGMGLAAEGKNPSRTTQFPWVGFGSSGGSRKKAITKAKTLVRGNIWVSPKRKPMALPLLFGARQGREYLWNFDRGLKSSSTPWMLTNGRILRVFPYQKPELAEFYLTLTLQKDNPPLALSLGEHLIGVDRGEENPASYAVVDAKGRLVERGHIGQEYSQRIKTFAKEKAELQRSLGGYTRRLRAKERNMASALGGQVIRELMSLLVTKKGSMVFENLSSGIVTRGGRGTLMGNMHYERILSGIEQKLSEAGCYEMPSAKKYRKGLSPFLRFVNPSYTSSTCSKCGEVYSRAWYDKIAPSLERKETGIWTVKLGEKLFTLPDSYSYFLRGRGEQHKKTDERLTEIFKGREWAKLSATSKKEVVGILQSKLVAYRPKRGKFNCPTCGHEDDADLQAALNIARKTIWVSTLPPKKAKSGDQDFRGVGQELWAKWYKDRVHKNWA